MERAQQALYEHLPIPVLVAWTFFLAVLGTVLAIPMKRNLINQFTASYVDTGRVAVEPLTEANTEQCTVFLERWCEIMSFCPLFTSPFQ